MNPGQAASSITSGENRPDQSAKHCRSDVNGARLVATMPPDRGVRCLTSGDAHRDCEAKAKIDGGGSSPCHFSCLLWLNGTGAHGGLCRDLRRLSSRES